MKILFLNHSDSKESLQGGQLALVELVQQWKKKNSEIEPIFISIGEHGKFSDICSQNGWRCFVLPLDWWLEEKDIRNNSFRTSQFLSDLSSITQVRQIVKEVNPSICFTNTITSPWLAFASAAEGIPHVWSCHESGNFNTELSFRYGYENTFRIIGELSQLVIANSAPTMDFLSEFMGKKKIILQSPVRSKETLFQLLAAPEENDNQSHSFPERSAFRIGCFGAVNKNKNQQLLFEALAPIAISGREFEIVIAGNVDQEYWASLTKSNFFKKISKNLIVMDSISNPLPLISSCDLVVSTSHYESFGMSIFESQYAGVPVISTPHLGAFEIIQNGTTGTILASYNAEELTKTILAYMNSGALTQNQGKAAAESAREFLDEFAAQQMNLLIQMEKLASEEVLLQNQTSLVALLNQSDKALPHKQLAKLSGLMGSIKVQKKYSPKFLYRVLKSRFGLRG